MPKEINLVSKNQINLLKKKWKLVALKFKLVPQKPKIVSKKFNQVDWIFSKRVCDLVVIGTVTAHQ